MTATASDEGTRDLVAEVPRPGSLTWRYAGDWRGVLSGRATLLLQVAHPVVGAGVGEHSQFVEDRWGRLTRTIQSANTFLGYRGQERGLAEGDRLREIHKDIKGVDAQGRRYHALNPEAYLWVHATLFWGILQTQRLFATPVPEARQERLYEEWKRLARALHITERHIPPTVAAFNEYADDMIQNRLEDNETVQLLFRLDEEPLPPPPNWRLPAAMWALPLTPPTRLLSFTSLGSLPPVLRERFGVKWTAADERRFQRLARAMRALDARLPERMTYSTFAARATQMADRRAARKAAAGTSATDGHGGRAAG